jgi:tetratricopeptide (TPR) repeat protein
MESMSMMAHPLHDSGEEKVANRHRVVGRSIGRNKSRGTRRLRRTLYLPAAVLCLSLLALAGCASSGKSPPLLKEGETALQQRDYAQAMTLADHVLASQTDGETAARALYLKGRALEDRPKETAAQSEADLRQAWTCYAAALPSMPSPQLEGYIRTSLGNVAYWLNDFALAGQQWERAYGLLDSDDFKAWVLYRRGLCLQRQSQWADADGIFAQVQRAFPDTEPARRAATKTGARAFYVQVGAFERVASADALVTNLRARGLSASKSPAGQLQRVVIGPFAKYPDAMATKDRLGAEFADAVITP